VQVSDLKCGACPVAEMETEAQARKRGHELRYGTCPFDDLEVDDDLDCPYELEMLEKVVEAMRKVEGKS
jgi:hypothetical protein